MPFRAPGVSLFSLTHELAYARLSPSRACLDVRIEVWQLRLLANLVVVESRMASTLSLVPSTPEPEKNSVLATDDFSARNALPEAEKSPAQPTARIAPSEDLLSVLRQSVSDSSQPPDSVIRATAEGARVLTTADGVAIAFRTKGVILCRARSGEFAPELGSYVNANSGISGECLRTASILVCKDTRTDSRVDNDVCQRMGIRSIVVVPLRGPVGIAGILEVFATRANAFGDREINSLRGLAEVAEAAYDRERRAQLEATRAALRSAHRLPALLARAVRSELSEERSTQEFLEIDPIDGRPERLLWAFGAVAVSLLLILGVWLSWHGPITELAEMEAAAAENRSPATQPASSVPLPVPLPKPDARVTHPDSQKGTNSKVLRVSAGASHSGSLAGSGTSAGLSGPQLAATLSNDAAPAAIEQAPAVTIRTANPNGKFAALLSAPSALPVMSAPVSHGVRQGDLIRKVDPVYPLQARDQHIAGPVVLELHVAEDGKIRGIRTVSGDPQLATAALQAVRQWQYSPTLLDGHPIETTKQVTVIFELP